MSWASFHIMKLDKGHSVQCRPHGNSMQPKINSGDLVTISPDLTDLKVDDIVLCRVQGRHVLHLISAIQGDRYQISNNKGHVNGWIGIGCIYGRVTSIDSRR